MLSDEQVERYARQLVMPELDEAGQEKLLNAHILVVGAGGLGSAVLTALVCAGVGHIGIIDGDVVDITNLNRQFVHHTHMVNIAKTDSAIAHLSMLNPDVKFSGYEDYLTAENGDEIITGYDLVIDCTDQPDTRSLVNSLCIRHKRKLVFGGAIKMDGQITVIDPDDPNSPCLHCIFPSTDIDYDQAPSCSRTGVLGTTTMLIGTLQAQEAIKLICGFGSSLKNKLLIYDGLNCEFMSIATMRDCDCITCANRS